MFQPDLTPHLLLLLLLLCLLPLSRFGPLHPRRIRRSSLHSSCSCYSAYLNSVGLRCVQGTVYSSTIRSISSSLGKKVRAVLPCHVNVLKIVPAMQEAFAKRELPECSSCTTRCIRWAVTCDCLPVCAGLITNLLVIHTTASGDRWKVVRIYFLPDGDGGTFQ